MLQLKISLVCCAFIGLNALVAVWRIAIATNVWNKQQDPIRESPWASAYPTQTDI